MGLWLFGVRSYCLYSTLSVCLSASEFCIWFLLFFQIVHEKVSLLFVSQRTSHSQHFHFPFSIAYAFALWIVVVHFMLSSFCKRLLFVPFVSFRSLQLPGKYPKIKQKRIYLKSHKICAQRILFPSRISNKQAQTIKCFVFFSLWWFFLVLLLLFVFKNDEKKNTKKEEEETKKKRMKNVETNNKAFNRFDQTHTHTHGNNIIEN